MLVRSRVPLDCLLWGRLEHHFLHPGARPRQWQHSCEFTFFAPIELWAHRCSHTERWNSRYRSLPSDQLNDKLCQVVMVAARFFGFCSFVWACVIFGVDGNMIE